MGAIPKRRWFQFHLSTALAMLLETSGIVYIIIRVCRGVDDWDFVYFLTIFLSCLLFPLVPITGMILERRYMQLPPSPTRRWYQLHRNTWIALALTVSALSALNLCGASRFTPGWSGLYGWPLGFNTLQPPENLTFWIDLVFNATIVAISAWYVENRMRLRSQ